MRGRQKVRQASPRYLSGWMWDLIVSSLFLLISSRAERSSSSRTIVAPFLRSPSSAHQTSIPRAGTFLGTPSTFPNLQTGSSRPESFPTTAGRHWRCLKLGSTADPPLRSSSARTDRGNEFVVSSLRSPVSFPFRGVSPARVNGRRRRRRARCRLVRGVKDRSRGRSACEARTVRWPS